MIPQRRRLNVQKAGGTIGMLQSRMSLEAVGILMNTLPRCSMAVQQTLAKRNRLNSAFALRTFMGLYRDMDRHELKISSLVISNQSC